MPLHRQPGPHLEPFQLRWHSVADPTTPSADIMSSPDPLNEATVTGAAELLPPLTPSPSRAASRSQRSRRSVSRVKSSPTKQTFELQVGSKKTPQKLLVTVETESSGGKKVGAKRQLFQSPRRTPATRRRQRSTATTTTTTTTVPLRDSIEEGNALETPRRRGRPRKSNGTPMPSVAERKSGTLAGARSARRVRIASDDLGDRPQGDDALPMERASSGDTSNKENHVVSTASNGGYEEHQAAANRRNRRRRPALAPDELVEIAGLSNNAQDEQVSGPAAPRDDDVDLIRSPLDSYQYAPLAAATSIEDDSPQSDLWMATLSRENTPVAPVQQTPPEPSSPTRRISASRQLHAEVPDSDINGPPEFGIPEADYVDLVPAPSDDSSIDEPVEPSAPQTNDTIAQGEGFSMIFMDSIPSFQGVVGGAVRPSAQEDMGEETSLIINNTLESVRRRASRQSESINAEAAGKASPAAESMAEDADVDELDAGGKAVESPSPSRASTPARAHRAAGSPDLRQRVLRNAARQAGFMDAAEAEMRDDGSRRTDSIRRHSMHHDDGPSQAYEDSFSEIPQSILAAATPHPRDHAAAPIDGLKESNGPAGGSLQASSPPLRSSLIPVQEAVNVEEEEVHNFNEEEEEEEGAEEEDVASPVASATARSDAGRLLTPDDTPPHPDDRSDDDQDATEAEPVSTGQSKAPRSEPPAAVRLSQDISTPEMQDPEPRVTAEVTKQASKSVADENQPNMPSDVPQPLNQSPHQTTQDRGAQPQFSATMRVGRALQSVTSDPSSPERREGQLGSPFRSSTSKGSRSGSRESQTGISLQQGQASAQHQAAWQNPHLEDPRLERGERVASRSSEATEILVFPQRGAAEEVGPSGSPVDSVPSSMRITPASEEAMSWVVNEGPISPRLRGDNTLQEASQPASTNMVNGTVGRGNKRKAESDLDELSGDTTEIQDDDTDIWELEARRETPKAARQQAFGKRLASSKRRRGAIQSPWLRGAQMPHASEKPINKAARHLTFKPALPRQHDTEDTLPPDQDRSAVAVERDSSAARSKANRFDLSSFFSSPASIPGKLAQNLLPSKTAKSLFGGLAKPRLPAAAAAPMLTGNSMFPRIAQGSVRAADHLRTRTRLSPVRAENPPQHDSPSPSPATPEQIARPMAAPQQTSGARQRQASQVYSTVPSTPPRMQLSHADIQKWRRETSNPSEESSGRPRRFLRPLPPKNASPTKSSMRSPMKPRTPGRVVEFTSSVLSPDEQARARQNHLPHLPLLAHFNAPLPPPLPALNGTQISASIEDDLVMADAPPLPQRKTRSRSLSRSVWTRQHWLLLDRFLKLRRQAPFPMSYERTAEYYLGKMVMSHGEAMRLERWHLDCVDAFKAEVGGWDEGVLAKRLFALLLGEERRLKGLRDRPSKMFH